VEDSEYCIFRRIPATDSDPKRPPIPIHSGRPFRSIPATPEGVMEAALDNRFESLYPPEKPIRRKLWRRGDYLCARSKKYYVCITKRGSRPDRLPRVWISAEVRFENTLTGPNRQDSVGLFLRNWTKLPWNIGSSLPSMLFPKKSGRCLPRSIFIKS
jgi:hypothetical protein